MSGVNTVTAEKYQPPLINVRTPEDFAANANLIPTSYRQNNLNNDLAQLEDGLMVYDALYRWCRDAQDETHNWKVLPS